MPGPVYFTRVLSLQSSVLFSPPSVLSPQSSALTEFCRFYCRFYCRFWLPFSSLKSLRYKILSAVPQAPSKPSAHRSLSVHATKRCKINDIIFCVVTTRPFIEEFTNLGIEELRNVKQETRSHSISLTGTKSDGRNESNGRSTGDTEIGKVGVDTPVLV